MADVSGGVRVAVVDDHPAIIDGTLEPLARHLPGLVCVARGRDLTALDAVDPGAVDVVILDIELGDGSTGPDNVGRLVGRGFRVLLYTQDVRSGLVSRCFRQGASGIVSKRSEHAVLAEAVAVVAEGEPYLSRDWAAILEEDRDWDVPQLAPREVEALRLYSVGLPEKLVARQMGVARATVHEYLKRARQKYSDAGRTAQTKSDLRERAYEDGHLDQMPGPLPGAPPRDSADPTAKDRRTRVTHRPELQAIRTRTAAVVGAVTLTTSVVAVLTTPHQTPRWFVALTLGAELVAVAWCVSDAWAGRRRPWGPAVLVGTSAVLLAILAWLGIGTATALPPVVHVIAGGLVMAPAALEWRGSLLAGAYLVVGLAYLREPALGPLIATAESAQHLMVILAEIVLWRMLVDAADVTERRVTQRRAAELAAVRARERAAHGERWNALIHDKVLGALFLAIRDRPAPAAQLASDAITSLTHAAPTSPTAPGPAATRQDIRSALADVAERLDLEVAVDVRGWPDGVDPQVWDAVCQGATEALTNVSRHSGQRIAWVEGVVSEDEIRLVVGDPGQGFDTGALSARAGRHTSAARLASVGGDVRTASEPGRGSRVTITWRAPHNDDDERAPWNPDIVRGALLVGCVAVPLPILVGLSQPHFSRSMPVCAVGAGVVLAATALLGLGRLRRATVVAGGVALVLTTTVLAANAAPPFGADWRWWFVGALDTAIVLTVLRFAAPAGSVLAAALIAAVVAGHLTAAGWTGSPSYLPAVPQLALSALAAALVRRGLSRATETVERASRQAAQAERAVVMADEQAAAFAHQSAELAASAGSALAAIAAGVTPDPPRRQEWVRLEGRLRDQLVAGSILTARTVSLLEDARDRGIPVEVVAMGAVGPRDPDRFEAVVGAVLPRVRMASSVVALWRPLRDGRLATVTVVGSLDARPALVIDGHAVQVASDEDATIVTLSSEVRTVEPSGHRPRMVSGDKVSEL